VNGRKQHTQTLESCFVARNLLGFDECVTRNASLYGRRGFAAKHRHERCEHLSYATQAAAQSPVAYFRMKALCELIDMTTVSRRKSHDTALLESICQCWPQKPVDEGSAFHRNFECSAGQNEQWAI
jgi:hypothetical protein